MASWWEYLLPLGLGSAFTPGMNEFMLGSKHKMKPFNKGAMSALEQLIAQGGGLQNNPLYGAGSDFYKQILSDDPAAFAQFEAPLKQQFEQQTVPGIAERFAGMGTGGGASSSSGLQNSLAQAGKEFSTNIAGLRSGLKMQAAQGALQYAQSPIQMLMQAIGLMPSQYYEIPGQPGLIQGAANSFAGGFGQGLGRGAAGGI